MMFKILLHNIVESFREKLPEILSVTVTGTGVIIDVIGWVNFILEVVVKLGYIAVSIVTVVYIIKKARNLKKS